MDLFFKGYVETKDKKCIEKFKDRTDFKTYEQIKNRDEFAGILADKTILVDVDDEKQSRIMLDIVDELQLRCRVYKTTRGAHFLFINEGVNSNKTHCKLACGLEADIKLGTKNSYSVLKFAGKEREIIYDKLDDEEYQTLPKFLLPVRSKVDFLSLDEGDGRNQALFNYILTLQSSGFSQEEARECIHIINTHVLPNPLPEDELETVLRDESFQKPIFFDGRTFLFDKFANYLIGNLHIIKINGQLHLYKDGIYVNGNDLIESEMIKVIPSLNRQKRTEVLSYINLLVDEDSKVSPANYIAFRNGIYDVNTDKLMEFDPAIIITNKIDFNYNANAYNEKMDKTLDKLACNDPEIRDLLEEVVGYCFYKRNELRKCFILIGNKSNGKSTYLDLIKELLGEKNTSSLDISEFGNRFSSSSLFNKLANIGDDIGDSFIDGATAAIFKKVVSGDRIRGEFKGQTEFFFNPFCKVLLSANEIPRIGKSKSSDSVIDRLIIVPFDARFSSNDVDYDPYIKYKLRQEDAMEYLIQLGIDGLNRVLDTRHFTTSAKVKKEIEEYEENNNPILLFFKDLDVVEIKNQPTKDVYHKYNEFCLANRFTPMSNIEFSKQVNKYYEMQTVSKRIQGKVYKIFVKKEPQ